MVQRLCIWLSSRELPRGSSFKRASHWFKQVIVIENQAIPVKAMKAFVPLSRDGIIMVYAPCKQIGHLKSWNHPHIRFAKVNDLVHWSNGLSRLFVMFAIINMTIERLTLVKIQFIPLRSDMPSPLEA
jgi:hypothetical protein